jgi:hypothetical protein
VCSKLEFTDTCRVAEFMKKLAKKRNPEVGGEILPAKFLSAIAETPQHPSGKKTVESRLDKGGTEKLLSLRSLKSNAKGFPKVVKKTPHCTAELLWKIILRTASLTSENTSKRLRLSNRRVACNGGLDEIRKDFSLISNRCFSALQRRG